MVHRWATSAVTGTDSDAVPNQTRIASTEPDLVSYYREGLQSLITALVEAPVDLEATTFLNDAPPPRRFWARRQAHETTVHGIDALAATLGRPPTTDEAAIDVRLAVDGIDELLCGFFTRGRSKLFDGEEYTIFVRPDDSDQRWLVVVAERLATTAGGLELDASDGAAGAAVTLSGPAAGIYLGLWNRGTDLEATGRADLLDRWRDAQRITWA
jgi:hypothetical protein